MFWRNWKRSPLSEEHRQVIDEFMKLEEEVHDDTLSSYKANMLRPGLGAKVVKLFGSADNLRRHASAA